MWVRSQDKARLTNVEDFRILKHSNGNYDIWGNNNCNLGAYSTEEKALNVLDMIQKCIIKGNQITRVFNGYSMDYTNDYNVENIVFQMPQDSEVK